MDRELVSALLIATALVGGCASVPPLTPAASQVRQITAEEAKACAFVRVVQYTDTINGMGKSYGLVHQAGDIGLRNKVGTVGGNAFVSTQADADWFWGHVNYSGEAYKCPR